MGGGRLGAENDLRWNAVTAERGIFGTLRLVRWVDSGPDERLQHRITCSEQAVRMEPFSTLYFVFIGLI